MRATFFAALALLIVGPAAAGQKQQLPPAPTAQNLWGGFHQRMQAECHKTRGAICELLTNYERYGAQCLRNVGKDCRNAAELIGVYNDVFEADRPAAEIAENRRTQTALCSRACQLGDRGSCAREDELRRQLARMTGGAPAVTSADTTKPRS
ncbi:MAG: hypothetical protein KBD01_00355 [Acidobacteria bacterium]|nr:hypothetical protein [Acidobacteriota bacterium]